MWWKEFSGALVRINLGYTFRRSVVINYVLLGLISISQVLHQIIWCGWHLIYDTNFKLKTSCCLVSVWWATMHMLKKLYGCSIKRISQKVWCCIQFLCFSTLYYNWTNIIWSDGALLGYHAQDFCIVHFVRLDLWLWHYAVCIIIVLIWKRAMLYEQFI